MSRAYLAVSQYSAEVFGSGSTGHSARSSRLRDGDDDRWQTALSKTRVILGAQAGSAQSGALQSLSTFAPTPFAPSGCVTFVEAEQSAEAHLAYDAAVGVGE